jgi:hypothetical protein
MDNRALGNGQGISQQNPNLASPRLKTHTRARQIFGWWPPLGWVGLISGNHAKNTSEQAIFQRHFVESSSFCALAGIPTPAGNRLSWTFASPAGKA